MRHDHGDTFRLGTTQLRENVPFSLGVDRRGRLVENPDPSATQVNAGKRHTLPLPAGHASATGRFDEEHLFYLMARGIDELSARRLVVHGFLNEIVQQLDDEALAERVQNRLEEELKVADAAIAAIYEREQAEKERK